MAQPAMWSAMIRKAVGLQWGVVLVLAGCAWLGFGTVAARSLLLGGAAVALPNTLLALWLVLRMRHAAAAGPVAVMSGEMLKLGLTLVLLVAVAAQPPDRLSWPALLVGIVGALKGHWLALLVQRHQPAG